MGRNRRGAAMADAPAAHWTAADVERVSPPVPGYAHVVPDLVVETASPTQSRQEMDGKAQQWLERGVPVVWVVWPARHQVDEWGQGDAPRTLGRTTHWTGTRSCRAF